jgi:hypothetical protein
MWFKPLASFGFVRRHSVQDPLWPDNGTTYLQAGLGDSQAFAFLDETVFDLVSVQLAGYSSVVPDAVIRINGFRSDGSIATTEVVRNGINFETFYFDPGFRGLTRVEFPTYGWSLDNLVVAIPEPSALVLFICGGLIIATMNRALKSFKF